MSQELCMENHPPKKCPYIIDHYKYSAIGWIILWIGISARPTRLIRTCSKCHKTVEDINDVKELKKYIGR